MIKVKYYAIKGYEEVNGMNNSWERGKTKNDTDIIILWMDALQSSS